MNATYDMFKTVMEENTNGHEVEIRYGESMTPSLPAIRFFLYDGFPSTGFHTTITYGVSLAEHPEWDEARPEFMLTVASSNPVYGSAMGLLLDIVRDKKPIDEGFCCLVNFPICDESEMKGVCFSGKANLPINPIRLADRDILIRRCFLIYEGEAKLISEIGVQAFEGRVGQENLTNPNRRDLS